MECGIPSITSNTNFICIKHDVRGPLVWSAKGGLSRKYQGELWSAIGKQMKQIGISRR